MFNISGPGIIPDTTRILDGVYLRPADQVANFWDFCSVTFGCSGFGGTGVQRISGGGSSGIYISELNANANAYPVTLFTRSFPATNNDSIGSYSVEFSGSSLKLSPTPVGKSIGYVLEQHLENYAFPAGVGTSTYTFSGTVDTLAPPPGWVVQTDTFVNVDITSGWTDTQGRPVFETIPVFSQTYKGNFSNTLALSRRLEDFPSLRGTHGSYLMRISHRVTFTRRP